MDDDTREGRDPAPAVTRSIRLLGLLADAGGPRTLTELAGELGLAKSSTANLCLALEAGGMVDRTPQGYRLECAPPSSGVRSRPSSTRCASSTACARLRRSWLPSSCRSPCSTARMRSTSQARGVTVAATGNPAGLAAPRAALGHRARAARRHDRCRGHRAPRRGRGLPVADGAERDDHGGAAGSARHRPSAGAGALDARSPSAASSASPSRSRAGRRPIRRWLSASPSVPPRRTTSASSAWARALRAAAAALTNPFSTAVRR